MNDLLDVIVLNFMTIMVYIVWCIYYENSSIYMLNPIFVLDVSYAVSSELYTLVNFSSVLNLVPSFSFNFLILSIVSLPK